MICFFSCNKIKSCLCQWFFHAGKGTMPSAIINNPEHIVENFNGGHPIHYSPLTIHLVKTLIGSRCFFQYQVKLFGTKIIIEKINGINFLSVLMHFIMAVWPC